MREEVAYVSLEEIGKELEKKVGELGRWKKFLDNLLDIVKNINTLEKDLSKKMNEALSISSALRLFLEGVSIEATKELSDVIQKLKELEQELDNYSKSLAHKLNEDVVSDYYYQDYQEVFHQVKGELSKWVNEVDQSLNKLKNIFNEAVHKIDDMLNTFERLVMSILRKISHSKETASLINTLNEELEKVRLIKDKIPAFENLTKIDVNELKGMFKKTIEAINSAKDKVRNEAIKNNLLSRDSIEVLEILIEENIRNADLAKVVDTIRTRLDIDVKMIRDILFELSEEGFIIMKVSIE